MNRMHFGILMASLLILSFGLILGCGSNPTGGGGGGGASSTPWIYVGNSDDHTISYINGATNAVASMDVAPYSPYQLAASPNGKFIYCRTDSPEVLVINTATNSVESTFSLGNQSEYDKMAVSGDGKYLYVTVNNTYLVKKIYIATGTSETVCNFGGISPYAIVLNSDSTKAYVATQNGEVAEVPLTGTLPSTSTSYAVLASGYNNIYDLAILSGKVYCCGNIGSSSETGIFDMTSHTVEILTPEAVWPTGITAVPGQDKIYVSDFVNPAVIYILKPSVPTFESTVVTGEASFKNASFMCVTADGRYVYVYDVSRHTQVCKVNTSNDSIEAYIPVGTGAGNYNNPVIIYK
jgi:DNA-binding beta-propeller fold protein YncE